MIYRLSDFAFPSLQRDLYGSDGRPWILEIGFGDGRFWPHYASDWKEPPHYLGVELSGVSLLKAHHRLEKAGLEGILTKLPAELLLREVVPPQSLSQIIVNFPDPWPKAGHLEHRLLRRDFWELCATRLRPDGCVLLTTDHEEYFGFALEQAAGVMDTQQTTPPPAALETKYALKWRDLGLAVHHARFSPLPEAAYRSFPALYTEQHTMPHAVLTLPDQFAPQQFEKRTLTTPQYTVVLLDLYATLRRDGWVCLAHVVEGHLTQEVLIGITPREDGTTLVRLAKFGGPIITPAVKAAVGTVTNWLQTEGAKVVHAGY